MPEFVSGVTECLAELLMLNLPSVSHVISLSF